MSKCDCKTFYVIDNKLGCLHKLFESGRVQAIVKGSGQFYLYRDKIKRNRWGWQLDGTRTRLRSRDQILLAIELLEKYRHIQKVRL